MDANYGQGDAAYGTGAQQKAPGHGVAVQGVTAVQYGPSGSQAWEDQRCWMVLYLVLSIIATVALIFMAWPLVFGTALAIIAASLHSCSCCAGCYGEDEMRGARIIQILSIISTVLDAALCIYVFVLAASVKNVADDYESAGVDFGVAADTLFGIFIGAAVIGVVHALMSLFTVVKFTQVIGSFSPVTTGRV